MFLIVDDILEFYKTAVDKTAPLDAMKSMKLPENLYIQTEYHRFHPGNISVSVVCDRLELPRTPIEQNCGLLFCNL